MRTTDGMVAALIVDPPLGDSGSRAIYLFMSRRAPEPGSPCIPGWLSPPRISLLGEGQWSFFLIGMTPHGDQLLGPRLAGVGQPQLQRPPQGPLGGGHRRR